MLLNENLIKLIPDKKLRNKLRCSFQYKIFNAKKSKEKIIMTILAKNEIDVIEENIKFHLKQGIDFIIATDNNSTDGTKEKKESSILSKNQTMILTRQSSSTE